MIHYLQSLKCLLVLSDCVCLRSETITHQLHQVNKLNNSYHKWHDDVILETALGSVLVEQC